MNVPFFQRNSGRHKWNLVVYILCFVTLGIVLGGGIVLGRQESNISVSTPIESTGSQDRVSQIIAKLGYKERLELAYEIIKSAQENQIYVSLVGAVRALVDTKRSPAMLQARLNLLKLRQGATTQTLTGSSIGMMPNPGIVINPTISPARTTPPVQAPNVPTTSHQSDMTNLNNPVTSKTVGIPLANPQDPQLQKLAQYQSVVGGFVSDQLMVFMNMPQSTANIRSASYYMANVMNEYAKYRITPVFIFEPTGDNGASLDLGKLKNGDYSANLELLFSMIKNDRKVTEDKIGIMVPYPEINTPAFRRDNFVPEDFPTLVNIFFDSIKKYYPNAQGGILLDAKTYDIYTGWQGGEYKSFAPYLTGINPQHIQSFGLQGFPWVSSDTYTKVYDPRIFLPIDIAEEAARILGVSKIWFNTGTMKRQYTTETVTMNPTERADTLSGILDQAEKLQSHGYTTMVYIFAQNKFATRENIDWSYIENSHDDFVSPHESVLRSFLQQAQSRGIKVGLYDK